MVSGDEIISDTWNLKEVDDIVYEIDCKKVTKGADTFGKTRSLLDLLHFLHVPRRIR